MRYHIKTLDNKYWVGTNGEFLTKNYSERAIYENKFLAKWYVDNTNLFGQLTIKKETKKYGRA